MDKSEELGADRFGYRSVHYVCDLGAVRAKLPEFQLYKDLTFEIQVRTVLQHAWAEIEHERSYKFSGILPTPYRRRLSSIAGMLEIADREFNALAAELDAYSQDVQERTEAGDLSLELSTPSVRQIVEKKMENLPDIELRSGQFDSAINELSRFGVHTLGDLDSLLSEELLEKLSSRSSITVTGLLRTAMMYKDADRYFDQAWGRSWLFMNPTTLKLLSERYGAEKVAQILKKHKINQRKTKSPS